MNQMLKKYLSGALLLALAVPASAMADDEAMKLKVDELTRKVAKLEDKTLSKWLDIGGDYRFRLDSMRGQTKAYTDANGTFTNAANTLQGNFFADPTGPTLAPGLNAGMLSGLMGFSNQMKTTTTFAGAQAFLQQPATQQMLGGLQNFAQQVPAYKPNNDTLYTNRLGIDLHAKATKDVTVNVRLVAYKTFGSQDDSAVTNG
ncbi:MAG TPA: DUF3373 family protein, partial [Geomonas sp.]